MPAAWFRAVRTSFGHRMSRFRDRAYSGFPQNDTLTNPPPQTNRARDEMCDRCLSVLEICLEFVSWGRDRFIAIAWRCSLAKLYFPHLRTSKPALGCFGLRSAVSGTE